MDPGLKMIYDSILGGDMKATPAHVQTALDSGVMPDVILNEGMITAMSEVGQLFEKGEYYVPEMLFSARAMRSGLAVLRLTSCPCSWMLATSVHLRMLWSKMKYVT